MRLAAGLTLVAAAALAVGGVGCGDSGSSSGGAGPGGIVLPDGGVLPLPDGAAPDGGAACPAPPSVVLEAKARAIALSGDAIVFIDRDRGPPFLSAKAGTIRKVKTDGTGDTTLYTPTDLHQINDMRVAGDTIYFLESERNEFGSESTRVFAMPVTGGTPRLVVYHADPERAGDYDRLSSIVAIDATSIYVIRAEQLGAIFWRVSLADGAEQLLFRGNVSSMPQLVGSDFYFRSSALNTGTSGLFKIAKIPANATTASPPPAVGTAALKGDLVAGAFGLLGTGATETGTRQAVSKWGLDGGGHTTLFDSALKSGISTELGPVDAGFAYLAPDGSESPRSEVWKVPLTGGSPTVVACNRGSIPRHGDFDSGSSNEALVAELDMLLTPTHLVWVERSKEGDVEKHAIYRTPR